MAGTAVFFLPVFRPAMECVWPPPMAVTEWPCLRPTSEKPSVLCKRLFRGLLPMPGLPFLSLTPVVRSQNWIGVDKSVSVACSRRLSDRA